QAVVYVSFLRPAAAEVRLQVRANSRADVLITPEGLAFGPVRRGTMPAAEVVVTLSDAGGRIESASATSDYVVVAGQRVAGEAGAAQYLVTARLRPDLPEGRWHGEVWLKTNQPAAPWVRVPLAAVVVR